MTTEGEKSEIDDETKERIKNFVEQHAEFLKRILNFGSPLQRAKAKLFLSIAGVEL